MEWSDLGQVFGGAALWGGIQKIVGTRTERGEEKRKDDIHTFKQLKELVLLMDERLKAAETKVDEQSEEIGTLKTNLQNRTLEVSRLVNEKIELEKNIKDLETRLAAAVARGAGIATSLERHLQWYKNELSRVMELYEQATGGKPHPTQTPFPGSPLDPREEAMVLKAKEDEITQGLKE